MRVKMRFLTALIAEKKRQLHRDPSQHLISGKRKCKLFKKWRRMFKWQLLKVLAKSDIGLDTKDTPRPSPKIHLKKKALKLKHLKRKGNSISH
ncbi:hypothetical protein JHK85_016352 [Glycine max]|nr:hypothetical protein JHK85_016352 [Glycine max]